MLKIGITGNIATGKSEVSGIFSKLGVPVISCDTVVRTMQEPGGIIYREIKKRWGERFMDSGGRIKREALAASALADKGFRKELEIITHGHVKREVEEFFSSQEETGLCYAAAEVPLLFEAGWDGMFDRIVVTYAGRDTQLKRLRKRKGIEYGDAVKWIDIQMDQEEKLEKANLKIDSEKDLEEIRKQIVHFIAQLKEVEPYENK